MMKAVIFDYYGVLVQNGRADTELVTILEELHIAGVKLFLISNANKSEAAEHPAEFPLIGKLFTKCYYSWQTGLRKPDPKAFELILEEQHLQPEEVIYFDDREEHVASAKALGIEAYLFKDAQTVRDILHI